MINFLKKQKQILECKYSHQHFHQHYSGFGGGEATYCKKCCWWCADYWTGIKLWTTRDENKKESIFDMVKIGWSKEEAEKEWGRIYGK